MIIDHLSEMGSWEQRLERLLPVFGHRNWIVIADSAYPAQSNPGIETIYTGQDHLRLLGKVLDAMAEHKHVRANLYLDAELAHVREDDAPGVNEFRAGLERLVGLGARVVEHEKIIAKLDETARLFNVVIFKSNLTIPYTSVFLEFDCGYWNEDAEKRVRNSLRGSTNGPSAG